MAFKYVMGAKALVGAEYEAFRLAHADESADALAMLHQLGAAGMDSVPAWFREKLGLSRPYCYQMAGWCVFFEVEGPYRGACMVTVLHVVDLERTDLETGKREAYARWVRELGMRP